MKFNNYYKQDVCLDYLKEYDSNAYLRIDQKTEQKVFYLFRILCWLTIKNSTLKPSKRKKKLIILKIFTSLVMNKIREKNLTKAKLVLTEKVK